MKEHFSPEVYEIIKKHRTTKLCHDIYAMVKDRLNGMPLKSFQCYVSRYFKLTKAEFLYLRGIQFDQRRIREGKTIGDTKVGIFKQRIGEFKQIYTASGWLMMHLVVWNEANGKVPKGKQIGWIDGDRNNCELSNLCLIDVNYKGRGQPNDPRLLTDKYLAGIMARDKKLAKYILSHAPELIELKRSTLLLRRAAMGMEQTK